MESPRKEEPTSTSPSVPTRTPPPSPSPADIIPGCLREMSCTMPCSCGEGPWGPQHCHEFLITHLSQDGLPVGPGWGSVTPSCHPTPWGVLGLTSGTPGPAFELNQWLPQPGVSPQPVRSSLSHIPHPAAAELNNVNSEINFLFCHNLEALEQNQVSQRS